MNNFCYTNNGSPLICKGIFHVRESLKEYQKTIYDIRSCKTCEALRELCQGISLNQKGLFEIIEGEKGMCFCHSDRCDNSDTIAAFGNFIGINSACNCECANAEHLACENPCFFPHSCSCGCSCGGNINEGINDIRCGLHKANKVQNDLRKCMFSTAVAELNEAIRIEYRGISLISKMVCGECCR